MSLKVLCTGEATATHVGALIVQNEVEKAVVSVTILMTCMRPLLIIEVLIHTWVCAVDEQIDTTPEFRLIGSRELRELFSAQEKHEGWSRPNLICTSNRLCHSDIDFDTLDLASL